MLRRPYGEITFLRGVTDDGRVLDSRVLKALQPRPSGVSRDEMWPLELRDNDWFDREKIDVLRPAREHALWIAKADALPDDWHISPETIVWASGVQTWKRLARRGVWVNGCADSLGEQESPRIATLNGSDPDWLKLTHQSGYTEGAMPSLATYRLKSKGAKIDLSGKKYFFWQSGSAFEYALSQNPWLKEMTHFCGPGNTQRILESNGIEPHVFLDHHQWLDEMMQ